VHNLKRLAHMLVTCVKIVDVSLCLQVTKMHLFSHCFVELPKV